RRLPRRLALEPIRPEAPGLSRAHPAHPGRVVRQPARVARDRLSGTPRPFGGECEMIADPIRLGLASGWKGIAAAAPSRDLALEVDVVIVGSGAGGGVTAETLAMAGLRVAIVEEGPLKSSSDFRMREREAYPQLYQESAARQTRDKAITILQGRSVG